MKEMEWKAACKMEFDEKGEGKITELDSVCHKGIPRFETDIDWIRQWLEFFRMNLKRKDGNELPKGRTTMECIIEFNIIGEDGRVEDINFFLIESVRYSYSDGIQRKYCPIRERKYCPIQSDIRDWFKNFDENYEIIKSKKLEGGW